MFVLGNLVAALATGVDIFLGFLILLIIVRALISWVSPDPYNPIVQFIERSTEPVLAPFRRIVPMHSIGIDLSPLFAILLIYFLKIFLVSTILQFAARLG